MNLGLFVPAAGTSFGETCTEVAHFSSRAPLVFECRAHVMQVTPAGIRYHRPWSAWGMRIGSQRLKKAGDEVS